MNPIVELIQQLEGEVAAHNMDAARLKGSDQKVSHYLLEATQAHLLSLRYALVKSYSAPLLEGMSSKVVQAIIEQAKRENRSVAQMARDMFVSYMEEISKIESPLFCANVLMHCFENIGWGYFGRELIRLAETGLPVEVDNQKDVPARVLDDFRGSGYNITRIIYMNWTHEQQVAAQDYARGLNRTEEPEFLKKYRNH